MTLTFTLLPFQQTDVDKLTHNKLNSYPNTLIADEMGTGKTYQAVALDLALRKHTNHTTNHPTLIIAPKATLGFWYEVVRTAINTTTTYNNISTDTVQSTHDTHYKYLDPTAPNTQYIITHYDVLHRAQQLIYKPNTKTIKLQYFHVIADEAHKLKNRKTKRTKATKAINTYYKTALSGTPGDNTPADLWSLLHWLYPTTYTSYWRFFNTYVDWLWDANKEFRIITGNKNITRLKTEIEPFTKRRTKKEVLPELPDKYYTQRAIELTQPQRKAYNDMKKDMLAWLDNEPFTADIALTKLIRLQQLANSYGTLEEIPTNLTDPITEQPITKTLFTPTTPSAKLNELQEVLEELGTQPVVIFTQFRKFAELIQQELLLTYDNHTIDMLTGTTKNPSKVVSDFQNNNTQILIATLGTGAEGITLHAASTVVFLDRTWSPTTNQQAEDRLHRIGQVNAVNVIDIMATKTVDMGKHQRLEKKKEWIRELLTQ